MRTRRRDEQANDLIDLFPEQIKHTVTQNRHMYYPDHVCTVEKERHKRPGMTQQYISDTHASTHIDAIQRSNHKHLYTGIPIKFEAHSYTVT